MTTLEIVPVTFAQAREFVADLHRHHRPRFASTTSAARSSGSTGRWRATIGHKFSIGVATGDLLVGVVMVGRPIARHYANAYRSLDRPPPGHKFSIGVATGDLLVGVVMVGRPIARHYDDGLTLEVVRSCTDGTEHVNSMLYGAAWRAAKALGYRRLITYTQEGESGSSLRGAGWRVVAERPARKGWSTPSRPRTGNGNDGVARTLWEAS